MLEILPDSQANVLALRASGRLTAPDYEQVFIPAIETIIEQHGKARVLLYLDEGFDGWEPGAVWDDAAFGLRHRSDFDRIAVVGGPAWVDWGVRLGNVLLQGRARTFGPGRLAEALAWVSDFPAGEVDGERLSYELDEDALILTVRPHGRLKKDDFLELRHRIDPVIAARDGLNGLVIVVDAFPGWADLAALVSHFEFVRDHHRRIGKVALVCSDEFTRLLARLAGRFVTAEVGRFDSEEAALEWIKGSGW